MPQAFLQDLQEAVRRGLISIQPYKPKDSSEVPIRLSSQREGKSRWRDAKIRQVRLGRPPSIRPQLV